MTCFPAQSKTAFKQCKEENQVLIASNVQIYTSGHPVLPQERLVADWKERGTTFFRTFAKPVTIEDGVWISEGTASSAPGVSSHTLYRKIVSRLEVHAGLYAGYDDAAVRP